MESVEERSRARHMAIWEMMVLDEGVKAESVPGDPGGVTKFGIAQRSHPNVDVPRLTIWDAEQIYLNNYWRPLHLDEVEDSRVAVEIFDTAVNMGLSAAKTITRAALRFLGEPIAPSGDFDRGVLDLINKWCKKDPVALHKVLNGFQFLNYVYGSSRALQMMRDLNYSADRVKFHRGWMRRIQYYRQGR